jgi:hypothetical protein
MAKSPLLYITAALNPEADNKVFWLSLTESVEKQERYRWRMQESNRRRRRSQVVEKASI